MDARTAKAWAGWLIAGLTLTGCASTGSSSSLTRPTATIPTRANPTPTAAQPTAAAPANGSAWGKQPVVSSTRTPIDAGAPAAPMGTAPAFTNQPTNSIGPTGGITPPPAPNPGATSSAPAGTPAGTTGGLSPLPGAQSMNSLNTGTPVTAAPTLGQQVVVSLPHGSDSPTTRTSLTVPRAVVEEPTTAASPPMPAAPGVEMAVPSAPVPTMAPVPVVLPSPPAPPPTKALP
jgi:hypothetical protein